MKRLALAILIGLALTLAALGKSGATVAARGDTQATPAAAKPAPFAVGVWFQPVSSFQKWRDRGVNTLIGLELEGAPATDAAKAAYVKTAHSFGFRVVGDTGDCDWINNGPDEPDGQGNVTPEAFKAKYAALKLANPGKSIFGNFDGEKTRWRPESDYAGGYFAGTDAIGIDWYPLNRGTVPAEGGFDIYTQRIDWAVRVAAGKPIWLAIETCDQGMRGQAYLHLPENQPIGEQRAAAMRGPTPDELEWEVTTAVAHGAKGIFYFSHIVGPPWSGFDGTPEDVAVRMRAVNLKLTTPSAPIPPRPSPRGPLDGATLQSGGFTYTLTSK